MIVGIDSGKTSAVACLGLDGRLLHSAHRTFAGSDWLVKEISCVGTPCVVATDRSRPNSVIRKANAAFNSVLFVPERDILSDEKRLLAKAAGLKNHHEQDAYASAIKAYYFYANKLNQAGRAIRGLAKEEQDRIKARIIMRHSISEAILNKTANRR